MQLWKILLVAILAASDTSGSVPGGISDDERKPMKDDPILLIVSNISSDIRSQVGAKVISGDSGAESQNQFKDAPITVLSYKTQVVAGLNYFLKAKIGNYIFHLRIYEPLPGQGQPSLSAVKGPMKDTDPIEYFP